MTKPEAFPDSTLGLAAERIDPHAMTIVETLREAGHEVYIVGGGVRDLLLEARPKDFDVATSAHPEAVRKLFRRSRLIGRRFSDPVVQADMKHWPFTVVQGPGGKPLIQVTFKGESKTFAPEEISSMVLIKMREIAEAYLGKGRGRLGGERRGRGDRRSHAYFPALHTQARR